MRHVGYEAETGTVLAVGAESHDLSHLGELGIKVNTNLEARFSHQYTSKFMHSIFIMLCSRIYRTLLLTCCIILLRGSTVLGQYTAHGCMHMKGSTVGCIREL